MANKKPQFKIGDKVFKRTIADLKEAEIVEIFSNEYGIVYMVKSEGSDDIYPFDAEHVFKRTK